jgi:hypothetical protein
LARRAEDLVVTLAVTFRTVTHFTEDLAAAGLSVSEVNGGWPGEPFVESSPIMVVSATKA